MKINLSQYAMEWVTEVGHELDGITNEEIMADVNANLDDDQDEITMDEADTIRRIINEQLAK